MKKDLQEKWNKVHLRELKDIEKGRATGGSSKSKDSTLGKGSYVTVSRRKPKKSRNDRSAGGGIHHLTAQAVLKDQLSNGESEIANLGPDFENDNYADVDNISKESPVFRLPSPMNHF